MKRTRYQIENINPCYINELDYWLLDKILDEIPISKLVNIIQVCKHWQHIVQTYKSNISIINNINITIRKNILITHLNQLKYLHKLKINHISGFNDENCHMLNNLYYLNKIDFSHCNVLGHGLKNIIHNNLNLTSLKLNNNRLEYDIISDDVEIGRKVPQYTLTDLHLLIKLKTLELEGLFTINNELLKSIYYLDNLRKLKIGQYQETHGYPPNILYENFYTGHVFMYVLNKIGPQLHTFSVLSVKHFDSSYFNIISKMTNLVKLNISETNFKYSQFTIFSKLTKLEVLLARDLTDNPFISISKHLLKGPELESSEYNCYFLLLSSLPLTLKHICFTNIWMTKNNIKQVLEIINYKLRNINSYCCWSNDSSRYNYSFNNTALELSKELSKKYPQIKHIYHPPQNINDINHKQYNELTVHFEPCCFTYFPVV